MFGGITYLGWFHTILGTLAIFAGIFLILRDRKIEIKNNLAKFYLISTVVTSISSLFIYNATGSFNTAHMLSILTTLVIFFAVLLHYKNFFGFLNLYLKELALTSTVFFSLLPTTAEFLQRLPPRNPFVESIEDPLVMKFYIFYVVIFAIIAIYQVFIIYKEDVYAR
tara:strand:- start:9962 stop:10462 length:501 start_codon:yes stop_codon:yes gene_type:complete